MSYDQLGTVLKPAGQSAYAFDSTRKWIESHRTEGLVQPNLLLRLATDVNFIRNRKLALPGYNNQEVQTYAIMNLGTLGQRVPHLLNWQVQEGTENEVAAGSFDMIDALGVSTISTTVKSGSSLPADLHSKTIVASYVKNSLGVTTKLAHNAPVNNYTDIEGIKYREENVVGRQFDYQSFTVTNGSAFPDPSMRTGDADNDMAADAFYPSTSTGQGSYYLLVGDEVVRVTKITRSGNEATFFIPPGGRAINGVLSAHTGGESVKALGMGPYTGDVVALGAFQPSQLYAHASLFRTGTCLTSYEGYGQMQHPLHRYYNEERNYAFTGYWFVRGNEISLGDDGVPRLKIDLEGPGCLLTRQTLNIDTVQRIASRYGTWKDRNGGAIWSSSGHYRDIPGDWVDFSSWAPDSKGAYPVQLKTEIAQHKDFFDHMRETQYGTKCNICREERRKFKQSNPKAKGNVEQRAIGKHVYKQSIRVMDNYAGPIKTYIRLMSTIAMLSWDHPPLGSEMSQRFTKIPNTLYDNMRNIYAGYIYNGTVEFRLDSEDENLNKYWDWSRPGYADVEITNAQHPLLCPFESTYDKAPFVQPMRDLAEVNGNQFWINRMGYPIFVPQNFKMRSVGGYKNLAGTQSLTEEKEAGEWFLSYGGSINNYSKSVNVESIVTQAWVTAKTAMDSEFTITSGGTAISKNGGLIMYGGISGHKQGLALTGGVQQLDTVSLDNVVLGLDWNINPATYGTALSIDGEGNKVADAKPPIHDGSPVLSLDTKKNGKTIKATKKVQRLINWFLKRRYIEPFKVNDKTWFLLTVDGDYGKATAEGVEKLERHVISKMKAEGVSIALGDNVNNANKVYKRSTAKSLYKYFETFKEFLEMDVYWYVFNGREWSEYVAHLVGMRIPMKKNKDYKKNKINKEAVLNLPEYVFDNVALQKDVAKWQKKFMRQVSSIGARRVDMSLQKAVQRNITSNLADPRIQPGDVIWANVPAVEKFVNDTGTVTQEKATGIYVTTIQRQMDLTSGTYTASYSGHAYRNPGIVVNPDMQFLTKEKNS